MKTANTLKLSKNVIVSRLKTVAQTCHPERSAVRRVVEGSLVSLAFLLTSCSDDSASDNAVQMMPSNMDVVAELDDLPACKKSNEGEQVWVKGESAARVCVDGKWYALASGNAECETQSLSDKSGVKIVCGGDSVGIVLNGENGSNGKNGVDGKNGENGINGKDGTNGKDGVNGTNGKDGQNGVDGVNGADGKDGKDGTNGRDGVDGKDGSDGKDGANGKDGENGKDGRDGIDGKDGTNGRDGVDGKDGANGRDGVDGKDGKDGKDGASCTAVTLADNSGLKILCGGDSVGVVYNGRDGVDGKDGRDGIDGKDGTNGRDGVDGKDGRDGVDGKDGTNGRDGVDGKDGTNGINGSDGTNGTDGKNGSGCSVISKDCILHVACGVDTVSLDVISSDDACRDIVKIDSEKVAVSLNEVSGVSQKGPFLSGTRVLVREMEDGRTLTQTGNSFNGKILNDKGEFKIKARMLVSQYVMLEASGYYRNEITGENSSSTLDLFAITDVNERNTVNINLLTHLEYERVIYLVTQKRMKVSAAKKQAQKEVFAILHIDATDFSNSEDLNIAGASDEDGALLAFSVVLQGNRSVSQLSELLTKIATDMEEDGTWNNDSTRTSLADWASQKELGGLMDTVRKNVTNWQLSSVVPNFEKFVHQFWTTEFGLGRCTDERDGEVLQNLNKRSKTKGTYFICKTGKWRKASTIEFDTYQWENGADGDVRLGDVNSKNCYVYENKAWRSGNTSDCSLGLRGCTALRQDTVGKGSDKVWHICDTQSWRNATTYEKDTFGWKDSTDGAIKKGNVTDSIYVFDKTVWRATSNVEAKLGGCVSAIADSVGKVGSTYYICKSNKWVEASAIEYDTYRWATGKDGDSKPGSVNTNNCYVYENSAWRKGNANDCSLRLRGCTALRQDTVGKGSDKVWYICDVQSWRNATTYEKDTFGWKDSTDGAIKKGDVTDSVYVFDKTAWRVTSNVEAKLGGCVSAIADSVGKVGGTYYICKSNEWVEANAIEYDTYHWTTGKDGDSKWGNVNTSSCYVFEHSVWRSGNTTDCSLGLRGCTALRQDTVGKGSDNVWYKCDAQAWRTATDIEKDTATWGAGEFDGEIRTGQVNKTIYYIYETSSNAWRNATTIEKDTYDYANNSNWANGTDGEIRKGSVTDAIYVFDATAWRVADDIEKVLGECVASIQDSVGKVDNTYYICKPRNWVVATTLQYDTYKQECSRFGQIIHGNVNTDYAYFCYGEEWKRFYGNESITYEKLVDERDGHIYRTVQIGTQTWMAENLNYADEKNYPSMIGRNWCMSDKDSCEKYGRLYTWSASIDSVFWSSQGMTCGFDLDPEELQCNLPDTILGICPSGWHIPSIAEWNTLYTSLGSDYKAMQAKGVAEWVKATDAFGFTALPAGFYHEGSNYEFFHDVGSYADFWSSGEYDNERATSWILINYRAGFSYTFWYYGKEYGTSVRCVKDEE